MPIDRLSLHEGVRLPPDPQNLERAVGQIAIIYVCKFVTLSPGEYQITPEAWTQNAYTHHLTVHDNDTATYRMFPVMEDAGVMDTDQPEQGYVPGGKMIKIPEEQSIAAIIGGSPDGSIRLFELILHR
jgi:hypothetical protein